MIRALCPRCLTVVIPGPLEGFTRKYECKACPGESILYETDDGEWKFAKHISAALWADRPVGEPPYTPPPGERPRWYTPTPSNRPVGEYEDIRAFCPFCLTRAKVIAGPYRRTYFCPRHPGVQMLIIEGDRDGELRPKHGYASVHVGPGYRDSKRESRVQYVGAGEWSLRATRDHRR